MEGLIELFNKLPLASLQALAGIVIAIVAYLNKSITVEEAFIILGVNGVGAGAVGHVRNGAGRGIAN